MKKVTWIVPFVFVLVLISILVIKPFNKNIPPQVPMGTFKNSETGEIFNYTDNNGYLVNCRQINCKSVYFDVDPIGNIIQIREDKENPIIGKIISVSPISNTENVNYTIEYKIGDKTYTSVYIQELCNYFKGGGKQCFDPAHISQPVIVNLLANNNSIISNLIIFNKILKADVLGIVNVTHQ